MPRRWWRSRPVPIGTGSARSGSSLPTSRAVSGPARRAAREHFPAGGDPGVRVGDPGPRRRCRGCGAAPGAGRRWPQRARGGSSRARRPTACGASRDGAAASGRRTAPSRRRRATGSHPGEHRQVDGDGVAGVQRDEVVGDRHDVVGAPRAGTSRCRTPASRAASRPSSVVGVDAGCSPPTPAPPLQRPGPPRRPAPRANCSRRQTHAGASTTTLALDQANGGASVRPSRQVALVGPSLYPAAAGRQLQHLPCTCFHGTLAGGARSC